MQLSIQMAHQSETQHNVQTWTTEQNPEGVPQQDLEWNSEQPERRKVDKQHSELSSQSVKFPCGA